MIGDGRFGGHVYSRMTQALRYANMFIDLIYGEGIRMNPADEHALSGRRRFLAGAGMSAVASAVALTAGASSASAAVPSTGPKIFNVTAYGAVAEGATDNTVAFQAAIDAANATGGGTVCVPPGVYRFTGTLTLPARVFLCGTAPGPVEELSGANGAVLAIATPITNTTPFIQTNGYTVIEDLSFHYPDQVTAGTPLAYPPTIQTRTVSNVLRNLFLPNVYQGISLNGAPTDTITAGRDFVDNVRMGVLGPFGILVDHTLDVSRLSNIHIWPFYGPSNGDLRDYSLAHGIGIVVRRADALQLSNIFCFGVQQGILLDTSPDNGPISGASYGQATNVQTDTCLEGGIVALATANMQGWTFTNLQCACPSGMSTGINLAPGGVFNAAQPPRVTVVGGSFWGATPKSGWTCVGSSKAVLHLVGVTQQGAWIAST